MAEMNPYSAPGADVATTEQYGQVKVLSASGRLGRLRYLAYGIGIYFLASLLQGVVAAIVVPMGESAGMAILSVSVLVSLFLVVFSFMLAIQRLHDMNASGWLALLMLVPVVNLIMLLVFLFAPGTQGENNYGAQPPPNGIGVVLTSLVLPVAFVGVIAAIAIPAYQDYVQRAQEMQAEVQP